MDMDRALRHAGRAGGIQPEASVVGTRRRGRQPRLSPRQYVLEGGVPVSAAAGDDDLLEERDLAGRRRELRQQLLRHDERLCTAVGEHVLVIFGGEQGIHRDRDDARLDRAEKRRGKVDRVGQGNQYPVLHFQAHRLQPRAEAVDALGELPERALACVVHVREPGRAAGGEIAFDQIVGSVVVARNSDDRRTDRMIGGAARGHAFLPITLRGHSMLSAGAAHAADFWEQNIGSEDPREEAAHGTKKSSKGGVGKTGGGCRKRAS